MKSVNFPLVSYCIITYNQECFIQKAVDAALMQSFENMEVIISDDCSSDNTFEVIQDSVKPNSKVVTHVNCNVTNLGINAHVNTVAGLSCGELIVIASGDDISMPNRVEKLVGEWNRGAIGIFSNAELIDAHGSVKGLFMRKSYKHLETWKEMVAAGGHGAWGCTFSWDKKVFDVFGELPLNILGEDAVIPFRCALLGRVSYIDEALVQYRDHGNNVSFWAQRKKVSGQKLVDIGAETVRFDLVMYKNWREDIYKAASVHLVDAADVIWAEEILSLHEQMRVVQLDFLETTFWRALLKCVKALWKKRGDVHRTLWMKRLVGSFLCFHMPLLYRVLLCTWGGIRG